MKLKVLLILTMINVQFNSYSQNLDSVVVKYVENKLNFNGHKIKKRMLSRKNLKIQNLSIPYIYYNSIFSNNDTANNVLFEFNNIVIDDNYIDSMFRGDTLFHYYKYKANTNPIKKGDKMVYLKKVHSNVYMLYGGAEFGREGLLNQELGVVSIYLIYLQNRKVKLDRKTFKYF